LQEYNRTSEKFRSSILNEAAYPLELVSITYGCRIKFSPSTIALAALVIALENLPPRHSDDFKSSINSYLGTSCYIEEVLHCRNDFLVILKNDLTIDVLASVSFTSSTNGAIMFYSLTVHALVSW